MGNKQLRTQLGPSAALECPACRKIFNSPVVLPCCGQSMCKPCILQRKLCPCCNAATALDRLIPNRNLELLVAEAEAANSKSTRAPAPAPAAHAPTFG